MTLEKNVAFYHLFNMYHINYMDIELQSADRTVLLITSISSHVKTSTLLDNKQMKFRTFTTTPYLLYSSFIPTISNTIHISRQTLWTPNSGRPRKRKPEHKQLWLGWMIIESGNCARMLNSSGLSILSCTNRCGFG